MGQNSIVEDVIVKMRSYWSRMGPGPNDWYPYGTHIHRRQVKVEAEIGAHSATNQGMPVAFRSWGEATRFIQRLTESMVLPIP